MTPLSTLLARDRAVSPHKLDEAIQRQVLTGGEFEVNLLEVDGLDESVLSGYWGFVHGLPPVGSDELARLDAALVRRVSKDIAQQFCVVPLRMEGGTLVLAAAAPLGAEARAALEQELGCAVELRIALRFRIAWALARHYEGMLAPRLSRLTQKLGLRPAVVIHPRANHQLVGGSPAAMSKLQSALAALSAVLEEDEGPELEAEEDDDEDNGPELQEDSDEEEGPELEVESEPAEPAPAAAQSLAASEPLEEAEPLETEPLEPEPLAVVPASAEPSGPSPVASPSIAEPPAQAEPLAAPERLEPAGVAAATEAPVPPMAVPEISEPAPLVVETKAPPAAESAPEVREEVMEIDPDHDHEHPRSSAAVPEDDTLEAEALDDAPEAPRPADPPSAPAPEPPPPAAVQPAPVAVEPASVVPSLALEGPAPAPPAEAQQPAPSAEIEGRMALPQDALPSFSALEEGIAAAAEAQARRLDQARTPAAPTPVEPGAPLISATPSRPLPAPPETLRPGPLEQPLPPPAVAPPPEPPPAPRDAGLELVLARLAKATARDEILEGLLTYAAGHADFVAVFVAQKEIAELLDARGSSVPMEELRQVAVSLEAPGSFRKLREQGESIVGAMDHSTADALLRADLARNEVLEVALVPIRIAGRVALVLWADNGSLAVPPGLVSALNALAAEASKAFERMIVARKRKGAAAAPARKADRGTPAEPSRKMTVAPVPSPAKPVALPRVAPAEPPAPTPLDPPSSTRMTTPSYDRWVVPAAPSSAERLDVKPIGGGVDSWDVSDAGSDTTSRPPPRNAVMMQAVAMPPEPEPPPAPEEPPLAASVPFEEPGTVPYSEGAARLHSGLGFAGVSAEGRHRPTTPGVAELPADIGPPSEPPPVMPSPRPVENPSSSRPPSRYSEPPPAPERARSVRPPRVPVSVDYLGPMPRGTPEPTASSRFRPDPRREPDEVLNERATEDVSRIISEVVRSGELPESTIQTLLVSGERGLHALFLYFPGPTRFDRLDMDGRLPSVSELGPVLRLVVMFRQGALPFLLEQVDSPEAERRYYATLCLGEIPNPSALPSLLTRVFDSDAPTRRVAVDVLRAYRRFVEFEPILEGLRAVVDDPRSPLERRRIAVNALGELRDPGAVPVLAGALADPDTMLAQAAHRTLVLLARQEFGFDADPWLQWYAGASRQHRVEWLIDALLHSEPTIRHEASEELKRVTGVFFGYYFNLPRRERERACQKYREWWQREGSARFAGA